MDYDDAAHRTAVLYMLSRLVTPHPARRNALVMPYSPAMMAPAVQNLQVRTRKTPAAIVVRRPTASKANAHDSMWGPYVPEVHGGV